MDKRLERLRILHVAKAQSLSRDSRLFGTMLGSSHFTIGLSDSMKSVQAGAHTAFEFHVVLQPKAPDRIPIALLGQVCSLWRIGAAEIV